MAAPQNKRGTVGVALDCLFYMSIPTGLAIQLVFNAVAPRSRSWTAS